MDKFIKFTDRLIRVFWNILIIFLYLAFFAAIIYVIYEYARA